MARKRKRSQGDRHAGPCKRLKIDEAVTCHSFGPTRSLVTLYYPEVMTLGEYALSRLPKTSKSRRRKISALVKPSSDASTRSQIVNAQAAQDAGGGLQRNNEDPSLRLAKLLSATLVGLHSTELKGTDSSRRRDFEAFSQQTGSTMRSSLGEGNSSQSEVSMNTFLKPQEWLMPRTCGLMRACLI